MSNNYYLETLKKIKEYIENKSYRIANEIVNEELSQPYIPLDVEKELRELQREIKTFLPEEINLYKEQNELNNLLNKDWTKDYIQLEKLFNSKNVLPSHKLLFLNMLFEQNINHEFMIKHLYINPAKLYLYEGHKLFIEIFSNIEHGNYHELDKNISIKEVTKQLMFKYFDMKFPLIILEMDETVVFQLISIANVILNIKNIDYLNDETIELSKQLNVDLEIKS